MNPAKTVEPSEMPFGLWGRVGPRNHVLHGSAQWRNMANTTEPSMCVGDAVYFFVKLLRPVVMIVTLT